MSSAACRWLAAGTGLAYLAGYLYVVGDLSLARHSDWAFQVSGRWAELWLQSRSLFRFEAVAMVEAGRIAFLLSPLNVLVAGALACLVALNVHGAAELRRTPVQCRVPGYRGSGVLASVPALVAGGACCAPVLLLVIGIPGLGAFAGLFGWLIPLSAVLLVASRWWQLRLGATSWFGLART